MPIQRIGKRIRRASGGMQERMGETAALLNESFAQARTVRAYRLEEPRRAAPSAAFDDSVPGAAAHDARAAPGSTRCWRCWAAPRWRR